MLLRQLVGEDAINELAMGAMKATLQRLESDGLMSTVEVERFLDQNICMVLPHDGPFVSWVKRRFGDVKPNTSSIVIAKL